VLVALLPLVWAAPLAAVGIVAVLAVVCWWYWRCRPSRCDVLCSFILGASVAGLILGILVLLGFRTGGIVLMLGVLGIVTGALVIAAMLAGCCGMCCAEGVKAPARRGAAK